MLLYGYCSIYIYPPSSNAAHISVPVRIYLDVVKQTNCFLLEQGDAACLMKENAAKGVKIQ